MKWAHTSKLLFLGAWLAVLATGYMASRGSVFAAGGGNNCIQCKDCEMMDTVWLSSINATEGTVWTNSQSPAGQAFTGTNMGGAKDNYGGGCDGVGTQLLSENYVTEVDYSSATLVCLPPVPMPAGTFECINGQNLQLTQWTYYPTLCTPYKNPP